MKAFSWAMHVGEWPALTLIAGANTDRVDERRDQLIGEAIQNLKVKWVVRKRVETEGRESMVDVFESHDDLKPAIEYLQNAMLEQQSNTHLEVVTVLHGEIVSDYLQGKEA